MNKTNALKLMLAEDGEFAECYRRWQQKISLRYRTTK